MTELSRKSPQTLDNATLFRPRGPVAVPGILVDSFVLANYSARAWRKSRPHKVEAAVTLNPSSNPLAPNPHHSIRGAKLQHRACGRMNAPHAPRFHS